MTATAAPPATFTRDELLTAIEWAFTEGLATVAAEIDVDADELARAAWRAQHRPVRTSVPWAICACGLMRFDPRGAAADGEPCSRYAHGRRTP